MNPILAYFLIALLGYLLGSSNLAYYIARRRGIDIHHTGSGNPGASNAMMLMGWKTGILVGVHDIGKAILAVWLCSLLFPQLPLCRRSPAPPVSWGICSPFIWLFAGARALPPASA